MSVSVFAGMMVSPHAIFTPDRDATMRQGSVGLDTQVSGSLASSLLSHVHRVPLVRLLSFAGPCGGASMSAPPVKTFPWDSCHSLKRKCAMGIVEAGDLREQACAQCSAQHFKGFPATV